MIVRRVLGGGPFAEVGTLDVAARSDEWGLVVAAGHRGMTRWPGRDVRMPGPYHRIGVHDLDGLACRHLAGSAWPVTSIALHPVLPLAALGTGEDDGTYTYQGELLLLDLTTGRVVSALDGSRQVRGVRWRDGRTLEVVFAHASIMEPRAHDTDGYLAVLERDDWAAGADGMITDWPRQGPGIVHPDPGPPGTARARSHVWAVEPLPGGRILAALDDVTLECWTASGELAWSVPGGGRQIRVAPDRESAWVTRPEGAVRLSLRDGGLLGALGDSSVLAARSDGWLALRDTAKGHAVLVSPDHQEGARVVLGRYDPYAGYFHTRHGPELLVLDGGWITAVDPPRATRAPVRRLFPLRWDAGGPAVRVPGALVHAADGESVVRRRLPGGDPDWVFAAGAQVTDLDTGGGTVSAALGSGEIVALDAAHGAVRWRRQLEVAGVTVQPLSLTADGDRLLVGTLDGRILDCAP